MPSSDDTGSPANAVRLDDIDLAIIEVLQRDGRIPNQALADAVGIAPSTCSVRLRSLVDRGVITRFRADVDLEALGLSIRALVSVRVHPQARQEIREFAHQIATAPDVRNVYFLSGDRDYLIEVAVPSTTALRDFVADQLSHNPAVASTTTSLIFEHVAGGTS